MKPMRGLLALAASALLGACVYAHLEQPKLSVVEVELLKGDVFRQQLRVRLHVQNPNDLAMPVRSITYEVELAGSAFAHGDSVSNFVIPAKGEAEFDVNVTTNAAAALLRMLGSNQGNPEYHITGKVQLSSGMLRNIPFEHTGTLRLK